MPVLPLWEFVINVFSDLGEDALKTRIQAMQVQCHAVNVVIILRASRAFPTFIDAFQNPL